MTKAAQLAGYLLEEFIAHLLTANGYRLLAREDDPEVLEWQGSGLTVKGRGAVHQADALGALDITIPFSLPVRLFAEAKNTTSKIGLDVIRNAHGVVHDVNEYVRMTEGVSRAEHLRRVQYRYSLFSTGGFTTDAQNFALAHQISLIDLSGPSWRELGETLRTAAQEILLDDSEVSLGAARMAVRHVLAVRSAESARDLRQVAAPSTPLLVWWAEDTVTRALPHDNVQELFVGFVDAPFVLALRATDTEAFRTYAEAATGPIPVGIGYGHTGPTGGEWLIWPSDEPEAFTLTFPLPGILERLLLTANSDDVARMASDAKQALMQSITMYVDGRPVRLKYERQRRAIPDPIPEDSTSTDALRRTLPVPDGVGTERSRPRPRRRPRPTGWTRNTATDLIDRLQQGQYLVQRGVIRRAVANGGQISRDELYEVAGFDPERSVRGLARSTNRITEALINEGRLAVGTPRALRPIYGTSGRAEAYEVPNDLVQALNLWAAGRS
ncbi:hypothetical protein ACH47X_08010 [Promicromonospora kroppenstedtii]|uniref:Restriction endonuclease n=1 Tax=Promicromonospora kroppenstedtii TaxID=440482 RepID=A0ABW7XH46_9MICO